jgi:MOSC domain-containing protein YiiM/ferredoxin-NADP reductase
LHSRARLIIRKYQKVDFVRLGKLLAVFAGRVAPLGPKSVRSAFLKDRTDRAVLVKSLGLEGDEQADLAVHGGVDKAVYAYPSTNYPLWHDEFPEHVQIWGPGSLGENLTLSGFDEASVNIGDVFKIGSAVLEVTQPRKPCFKLALRFDGDQRIAPRMIREGRTGWYFRVIQEGHLAAGDQVELLDRRHEEWSIKRINQGAYDRSVTEDELRVIAALPELSAAWRNQTVSAANSLSSKKSASKFRAFELSDVFVESRSIRSLTFTPVDGENVPLHEPGQHVQIRLTSPGSKELSVRRYTISSAPNGKNLRISVKLEDKGRISSLLHQLKPGDQIEISRPQGRFVLAREAGRPVALISAGVGITPMISMLHAAVTQDGRYPFVPRILFLHGARSGAEHAFAEQVRVSLTKHPKVISKIFYSQPTHEDWANGTFDHDGRMSLRHVGEFPATEYDYYICGPVTFMNAIINELKSKGVPDSRIRTETFSFSSDESGAPPDVTPDGLRKLKAGAKVRFENADKSVIWNPEQGTLLDLALANGIDVSSDCRMGICGACSTKIANGEVTHLALDGPLPERDEALLCRAVPKTDVLVLSL